MQKNHYVCKGGCGNVSDYPGTCQAEGCRDEGKELLACACEDDQHAEAGKAENESNPDGIAETF